MSMDAKQLSRFRFVVAMFALCTFATACASDTVVDTGSPTTVTGSNGEPSDDGAATDPAVRLVQARQMWADNGPSSYAMTTQLQCFCPMIEWKNIVVDGQITSTVSTGEDAFVEPQPQTMEDLFDEVDTAIRDGYARLDLEFDAETGALLSYWVDVDEMIADEEHGLIVTLSSIEDDVTETTVPPETTVPHEAIPIDAEAMAGLQDDYPCGFGFAKGNSTQTLALIVYSQGGYSETGPDVSSPIEFPNDDWVGELHTGSDLFANWCDDVMEEGEPIPEVHEVWTVVAGTLTVTETDSANVVEGVLSDVVIESPSGERLEVAEIALSNTGYGFFAG